MNDQFDDKLTGRIREVFENYEHPPADEGWMKLREHFPAQKGRNKVAWLWWSSAAAVLLIFLSIGLLLNNHTDTVSPAQKVAVKPIVRQQPAKDTADLPVSLNKTDSRIAAHIPTKNTTGSETPATITKPYTQPDFGPTPVFVPNNAAIASAQPKNNAIAPAVTGIDSQKVITNVPAQQIAKTQAPAKPVNETPVIAVAPAAIAKTNSMAATKQPAKSITELLADDGKERSAKKTAKNSGDTRKVSFSVYAATYFNYAQGSDNQMNAGAGFTSDIKLSKNIKFSTGVSLAQNSLSYNAMPPSTGGVLMAAAPQIKQANLFNASAVLPEFKNYNASLVGIDIPLNIKYQFNPQKSDTYITAGLSSGTFINERYTYTYSYGNGSSRGVASANSNDLSATVVIPAENQTSNKSFGSFYFAKTLNVAFGIGVPVGKNRLVMEPFLKYPLGGLGAQQINFGSSGLNLKFNFTGAKK